LHYSIMGTISPKTTNGVTPSSSTNFPFQSAQTPQGSSSLL
jgi:hypothetical protein